VRRSYPTRRVLGYTAIWNVLLCVNAYRQAVLRSERANYSFVWLVGRSMWAGNDGVGVMFGYRLRISVNVPP
jgi:hypothetical protein